MDEVQYTRVQPSEVGASPALLRYLRGEGGVLKGWGSTLPWLPDEPQRTAVVVEEARCLL